MFTHVRNKDFHQHQEYMADILFVVTEQVKYVRVIDFFW